MKAAFTLPLAQYLVGEGVKITPRQPHGREFSLGCPQFDIARSWDNYASQGVLLSAVASRSILLPTRTNEVEVRDDGNGGVELSFLLSYETKLLLDQVSALDRVPEITIYLDPDRSRSSPEPSANSLEAFDALLAGVFPEPISLATQTLYPRRGLPARDGDGRPSESESHPAYWMAQFACPLSHRFARLPLIPLLDAPFAAGERVTFTVELGREWAKEVAQNLSGRLFLNHVLFWNYLLGQLEPQRSASDLSLRGANAIVLDAEDTVSGALYYDEHFASCRDPSQTFRVHRDTAEDVCRLEFPPGEFFPGRMRVRYLIPVDWEELQVDVGETCFERSGSIAFAARCQPFPTVDSGEHSPRPQNTRLAWSLAVHPQTFCTELPMTRRELRMLILDKIPPQLKRLLSSAAGSEDDWLRIETVIRRVEPDPLRHESVWGRAMPVTSCHIRLATDAPLDELSRQSRWLTRRVQESCPASVNVEIVLERESKDS
ncbi:hypothetical protein [Planctopirus hydrillae]|uniref:hypothetical protein n=1 Tax=Planctopirus hydrillae TaxID=1841610 RepID=UPI00104204B1|nr:hypothetical protein [Planctopirus hydrillae]